MNGGLLLPPGDERAESGEVMPPSVDCDSLRKAAMQSWDRSSSRRPTRVGAGTQPLKLRKARSRPSAILRCCCGAFCTSAFASRRSIVKGPDGGMVNGVVHFRRDQRPWPARSLTVRRTIVNHSVIEKVSVENVARGRHKSVRWTDQVAYLPAFPRQCLLRIGVPIVLVCSHSVC